MKSSRQLERYFKGAANHYRLGILYLLERHPDMTLGEISDKLDGNLKTVSEHARRLALAGLVNKKYQGQTVEHSLTPYGKKFVAFAKTF